MFLDNKANLVTIEGKEFFSKFSKVLLRLKETAIYILPVSNHPPCRWEVEYVHRFSVYCMRQLKGCPDGSASTAWDYAGLIWNLYSLGWRNRDAGPKRCHYSQNSRAQSPLNPFYRWCNMLLTVLYHFPVVSISHLLYWNSSILPLHLPPLLPPPPPPLSGRELGAILI